MAILNHAGVPKWVVATGKAGDYDKDTVAFPVGANYRVYVKSTTANDVVIIAEGAGRVDKFFGGSHAITDGAIKITCVDSAAKEALVKALTEWIATPGTYENDPKNARYVIFDGYGTAFKTMVEAARNFIDPAWIGAVTLDLKARA
jgi:hypothetical protein